MPTVQYCVERILGFFSVSEAGRDHSRLCVYFSPRMNTHKYQGAPIIKYEHNPESPIDRRTLLARSSNGM